MNIFRDIKRYFKIKKAIKKVKAIAKDHTQLGIDTQKAILNIKADLEVLGGLLPSYRGLINDIKALINE